MRKYKLLDMLFAIAADHRQYPGERSLKVDDPEHRRFKLIAKKKGFALENPMTFFAQHIYCSQPSKILPQ